MDIDNLVDLQKAINTGPYAWPGGYPVFFLMADCQPVSFDAVVDNYDEVLAAFDSGDAQWRPIVLCINWEDTDLYCAHTNKRIEAAYE